MPSPSLGGPSCSHWPHDSTSRTPLPTNHDAPCHRRARPGGPGRHCRSRSHRSTAPADQRSRHRYRFRRPMSRPCGAVRFRSEGIARRRTRRCHVFQRHQGRWSGQRQRVCAGHLLRAVRRRSRPEHRPHRSREALSRWRRRIRRCSRRGSPSPAVSANSTVPAGAATSWRGSEPMDRLCSPPPVTIACGATDDGDNGINRALRHRRVRRRRPGRAGRRGRGSGRSTRSTTSSTRRPRPGCTASAARDGRCS